MILQQIENAILEAKKLPNSESKNRILSHLKDARAHAIVEMSQYSSFALERLQSPANGQIRHGFDAASNAISPICICLDGAVDLSCPVHKR